VLVIDEEIPWPANTGKRLRTLNLLSALSSDFAIDLLVHANAPDRAALEEMGQRGLTVRMASSRVPAKNGLALPVRVALSLVARLPYSVYSHYQRGYQRELNRLLAGGQYQLVHCEWTPYTAYVENCTIPVVVAAHNMEWQIWDRLAAAERRFIHRQLFRLQTRLMRRFEQRAFARSLWVTAVTEDDAKTLRAMGCREVVEVPNGVDTDYYRPRLTATGGPISLVFTGSMDWMPNQDAIRWFIDEVHPLLRSEMDYRLLVVGRQPPRWLTTPGLIPPEIQVTGTVDDIRPWIARSSLSVVPLRAGGGSRLKILEALAMARPVVSTTVGAEGLEITEGVHVIRADSPSDFAAAILTLIRDPTRRSVMGEAGRNLVEDKYSWDRIAPLQAQMWRRAIAEPAPPAGSVNPDSV
jgi:glycosyltransferase involved in cell wall biosynthesis